MPYIITKDGVPVNIVDLPDYPLFPGQIIAAATEEECEAVRPILIKNLRIATRNEARKARFREESDPLLAQYLAGEVDKETWLAKRAQIRAEIP